jgi:hypothetical protein
MPIRLVPMRFTILAVFAVTVAARACDGEAYRLCLTQPSACETEGGTPAECAGQ